ILRLQLLSLGNSRQSIYFRSVCGAVASGMITSLCRRLPRIISLVRLVTNLADVVYCFQKNTFGKEKRSMKVRVVVLLNCLLALGLVGTLHAQDTARRTRELVAALDKTKSKSKEKKGIKVEVYVAVQNEAVVKADPAAYSGTYTAEDGMHRIELTVSADGSATGNGYDDQEEGKRVNYILRGARIDGALLTGTKVYSNGAIEKLEAVFTNRKVRSGENEKNATETAAAFG